VKYENTKDYPRGKFRHICLKIPARHPLTFSPPPWYKHKHAGDDGNTAAKPRIYPLDSFRRFRHSNPSGTSHILWEKVVPFWWVPSVGAYALLSTLTYT